MQNNHYRPQRSWGKVIFSQACVIMFTGGVPGPGRVCLVRGVLCLVPGGPGGDPPQTATATGGTHPTGMHSCFLNNWCVNFPWYSQIINKGKKSGIIRGNQINYIAPFLEPFYRLDFNFLQIYNILDI